MQNPKHHRKGKLYALGMIFLWLALIAGVLMVMVHVAEALKNAGLL